MPQVGGALSVSVLYPGMFRVHTTMSGQRSRSVPPPNFANVIIYVYERVCAPTDPAPRGALCVHFSYLPVQKTRFAAALESIKTKLMTIMYDYARRIYIYALYIAPNIYTYKKRLNLRAEINFANSLHARAPSQPVNQREFHTAGFMGARSFSTSVAESACFSKPVCMH